MTSGEWLRLGEIFYLVKVFILCGQYIRCGDGFGVKVFFVLVFMVFSRE